jgi:hypothetical protein
LFRFLFLLFCQSLFLLYYRFLFPPFIILLVIFWLVALASLFCQKFPHFVEHLKLRSLARQLWLVFWFHWMTPWTSFYFGHRYLLPLSWRTLSLLYLQRACLSMEPKMSD